MLPLSINMLSPVDLLPPTPVSALQSSPQLWPEEALAELGSPGS